METVLIFASQVMMVIMGLLAGHGTDREVLEIIAMEIAKEGARIPVLMDAFILVVPDVGVDAVAALEVAIELVELNAPQSVLEKQIIYRACKRR